MADDGVFKGLLTLHAAAGMVALVVAPVAMVVKKGANWHRLAGKTFFFSMAIVCISSVIMAVLEPNDLWLALLAVFSFHMCASGYRALYLKKLHQGLRPQRIDLLLHGVAGLVNGGLLIWGLSHMLMGVKDRRALLFTVFGAIGMFMVFRYINEFYKRKHDRREWFYGHITGFFGGYIATLSAFSAVNLHMVHPMWLRWLWPTILGVPVLVVLQLYYRRKFANGSRVRDIAEVRIH